MSESTAESTAKPPPASGAVGGGTDLEDSKGTQAAVPNQPPAEKERCGHCGTLAKDQKLLTCSGCRCQKYCSEGAAYLKSKGFKGQCGYGTKYSGGCEITTTFRRPKTMLL